MSASNYFSRLLALAALTCVIFLLFPSASGAQEPPCPPTLCLDGEQCPPSDCVAQQDDLLYDLGDVPFEIIWPTAPNITSEVTVSTRAALLDSLQVSGRRTILRAGTYGDFTLNGTDKELVLESGVNIGYIRIDGQRFAIRGAPARDHTIRALHGWSSLNSDLLFSGINVVSGTTNEVWQEANELRGDRIAVLHSYIDMVGHAMFMGTGDNSHVIVANTWIRQHRGEQAGPRIHSASNLVFVDSRFEATVRQSWRLHSVEGGDSRNVVLSRNEFVGSGIQLRPNSGAGTASTVYGVMADIWMEDNVWYHDRNVIIQFGNPGEPIAVDLRLRNNTLYSDLGGFPGSQHPSWDVSGNTSLAYRPPPPWQFR